MKRLFYPFATIFLLAACNQAVEPKAEKEIAEKITEEEALELLHTWTLNNVLDDSWLYSGSADGSTSSKTSTIEEFRNADYFFEDISYQNLDVRLYGDIAVVRGKERMVILGSSKQDTTVINLRFTDVYQKKDGKVRAIATHSSPIE